MGQSNFGTEQFWDRVILGQSNFRTEQLMDEAIHGQSKVKGFDPKVINLVVRDFYFFKRSQYPQLSLVHKNPQEAHTELQEQSKRLKFVEIGKVMLVWGILKNVSQVVQRVVFLHEDLVKLPSFPRKALEAELDLFSGGEIGKVR